MFRLCDNPKCRKRFGWSDWACPKCGKATNRYYVPPLQKARVSVAAVFVGLVWLLGNAVALVDVVPKHTTIWGLLVLAVLDLTFVGLIAGWWTRKKERSRYRTRFLELAVRHDLRSKQLLDEDEDYPPGSGEGDPRRPVNANG